MRLLNDRTAMAVATFVSGITFILVTLVMLASPVSETMDQKQTELFWFLALACLFILFFNRWSIIKEKKPAQTKKEIVKLPKPTRPYLIEGDNVLLINDFPPDEPYYGTCSRCGWEASLPTARFSRWDIADSKKQLTEMHQTYDSACFGDLNFGFKED